MTPLRRLRGEAGQVTAFVTIFTIAILFVAGLVLDGGNVLAARRQAANEAEAAARAGAQALSEQALRDSNAHVLDASRAVEAAAAYVRATGHRLAEPPVVRGDTVSVTVSVDQPIYILGIGGLHTQTVTATGTARNVRGVTGPAT